MWCSTESQLVKFSIKLERCERYRHVFVFLSVREPGSPRDRSPPPTSKSNKSMRSTVKTVDKDRADLYSDGDGCDKAYVEKITISKRKQRYMCTRVCVCCMLLSLLPEFPVFFTAQF